MRILVTGANGQLGRSIKDLATDHSAHTFWFTDVDSLDICRRDAVRAFMVKNRVELVVNCAAYTAVDKAEDDEEAATLINALAPGYLAAAAGELGAGVIHISPDYVFDGRSNHPYGEDKTPCPLSVYGRTKLCGEQEVMQHCPEAVIVRTSWLYSEYGHNFMKTMLRLGPGRERVEVVCDQIGTPTYAAHLAGALLAMVDKGLKGGIYHYSNEGVCSWYDFAVAIFRLHGLGSHRVTPIHTDQYPVKAMRPVFSVLDKTKIKNEYGLAIPHWEDGLRRCYANYTRYNHHG